MPSLSCVHLDEGRKKGGEKNRFLPVVVVASSVCGFVEFASGAKHTKKLG